MKGVKCKKLLIDRAKAPTRIGTLKDVSLFGNFQFPTNGSFASGMTLQSLAGIGKVLQKSKEQLDVLSGRHGPIAGRTGAKVSDEVWRPTDLPVSGSCEAGDTYAVRFIQQECQTPVPPSLSLLEDNGMHDLHPSACFALKKGGTKRVTFTQEQKDIMVQFYDRQKHLQIKANASDAIKAMKAAGVPELKESQIRSWWSTHHRKQKQLVQDMREDAQELRRCTAEGTSVHVLLYILPVQMNATCWHITPQQIIYI